MFVVLNSFWRLISTLTWCFADSEEKSRVVKESINDVNVVLHSVIDHFRPDGSFDH